MCYFEILFIIIKSEALETWVSWGYYNSNSHCQSFDCKNPKLFRYPKCCLSKKCFWKNEIEEMSSHDWQTYYAGEGTWKELELVNQYEIMSIDEKHLTFHDCIFRRSSTNWRIADKLFECVWPFLWDWRLKG